jgi:hypothetical protein
VLPSREKIANRLNPGDKPHSKRGLLMEAPFPFLCTTINIPPVNQFSQNSFFGQAFLKIRLKLGAFPGWCIRGTFLRQKRQ